MEVNGYSQGGQPSIDIAQKEVAQVGSVSNFQPNVATGKDRIEISSSGPSSENNDIDSSTASEQKIVKAVDKLNIFLEDNKTHAVYSNHSIFKSVTMVKIIDDKTGEVVQEMPPQKILDMVAKMCEIVGLFLDKKA